MDILIRMTGIALLGSVISVLLRKEEPEMAFLSVLTVTFILTGLLITVISYLKDEAEMLNMNVGISDEWLICMIKMMGCSLISGISSRLCLDAGLQTAAYLIECGGTAVGLIIAFPICKEMLELVREIVW